MDNRQLLQYIEMLRQKSDTNKLIVFVGAGVSKNVEGMPDWYELIKKMAEAVPYSKCTVCRHKEDKCQESCVFQYDYSQDELLKIPQYLFNKDPGLYDQILAKSISAERFDAPLSKAIFDLNPAHIITTNFDKLIESSSHPARLNYDLVIRDSDLLHAGKNRYIIKMHGDIDEANRPEIVLKEADFLEYSQRHVLIETFIKALIADHTILFLGYSMNDYNIKLIVSWLNYIRSQNDNAISESTRIGYIVQDAAEISERDIAYFDQNYIGIINLHNMPLIKNIPDSLRNDIGKRLLSFLSVVNDDSLEVVLGRKLIYENAVSLMSQYRYVDFKTIARLLHLSNCIVEYGNVTITNSDDYDSITQYLDTQSRGATQLASLMMRAGIHTIEYYDHAGDKKYSIKEVARVEQYTTPMYQLYLANRYEELSASIGTVDSFEGTFYGVIVQGYVQHIYDMFKSIDVSVLSEADRIVYLFNQATWKAFGTWRFDKRSIEICLDGIASKRTKRILQPISNLLTDNSATLMLLNEHLHKLKDQYAPNSCVIGGSLAELNKIKIIAYDVYNLFFMNHLFFERTTDLKNIIRPYIEAMMITNSRQIDIQAKDPDFPMQRGHKTKYQLNLVDFDMMTKLIKSKHLAECISEYQVEHLLVDPEISDAIIDGFVNISQSMLKLKAYGDCTIFTTFVNYCTLLPLIQFVEHQKKRISKYLDELFENKEFIENFFSVRFYEWRLALEKMQRLVAYVGVTPNFAFVKKLIKKEKFAEYYVNINHYVLRKLVCCFVDTSVQNVQNEIGALLRELPSNERIWGVFLLKKCITDEEIVSENKTFLRENFELLKKMDLTDFAFDGWISLDESDVQALISDILATAKNQIPGYYVFPDPLENKLQTIYLLYITDVVGDISPLKEIAEKDPILQFFVDIERFDFAEVDFSYYMWQNIARVPKYLELIIAHKDILIPKMKQRVEYGIATEFEKKMLYGCFMGSEVIGS